MKKMARERGKNGLKNGSLQGGVTPKHKLSPIEENYRAAGIKRRVGSFYEKGGGITR